MRIEKEGIVDTFDRHCKGKYPREFGNKHPKSFDRNYEVGNAEELYNICKCVRFKDCYASVYSFGGWHDTSKVRKQSAVLDTLLFDLDHKTDLGVAFREARKLVKFLVARNTVPRIYFSGMKGFHIYIDFPPVEVKYPNEVVKRAGIRIAEKLKLKCVDSKVFDLARLIRLPLTIHTGSGYRCTPLSPDAFLKLDLTSLLHFCKCNYSELEVQECRDREFRKLLEYEDFLISSNVVAKEVIKPHGGKVGSDKRGGSWKQKRIQRYVQVLREYGRLTKDGWIGKKHEGNEHYARLHLNCLMVECGYSDEEIREVFRLSEDYKPEKVDYFIDYNRAWLRERG